MKPFLLKGLLRSFESTNGRTESLPDRFLDGLKQVSRDWLDRNLLWIMNYYPPYLGAGIQVDDYDADFRYIRVKMELKWWNQNYVGTQFGGSLYSMCDPFYMLMVMKNLGSGYEVWDKSAEIDFLKPGRGTVYADFELDEEDLETIQNNVSRNGVSKPVFTVDVTGENGQKVAKVRKELHVTP